MARLACNYRKVVPGHQLLQSGPAISAHGVSTQSCAFQLSRSGTACAALRFAISKLRKV